MDTCIDFNSELHQVRAKIKHLKKINETLCKNGKQKLYWKPFRDNDEELDKNSSLLQQAFEKEASIVDNCYKKCLQFIELSLQAKNRRKLQRELTKTCQNNKLCYGKNNYHKFSKGKNLNNSALIKANHAHADMLVSTNSNTLSMFYKNQISVNYKFNKNRNISSDLNEGMSILLESNKHSRILQENCKSNVGIEDYISTDLSNVHSLYKQKSKKKLKDKSTLNLITGVTDDVIYLETVNNYDSLVHHGKLTKYNQGSNSLDQRKNHMNHKNKCCSEIFDNQTDKPSYLINYLDVNGKEEGNDDSYTENNDSDVICLDHVNIPLEENITKSKLNTCSDLYVDNDHFKEIIPLWDFEDEPIDFPVPPIHAYESVCYSKKFKKLLKTKEIKVRDGKWSNDEEKLLCKNYNNFIAQFGINDPYLLLGIGSRLIKDNVELRNVKKFIKAKHFYLRLAKDLNFRTLYAVYYKARDLFDPLRKVEKCNDADIVNLLQLVERFGRKWYFISKILGKSAHACYNIYHNYQTKLNNGKSKWTDEEIKKLISAMNSQMNSTDKKNKNEKINWVEVSKLVCSKSRTQCRRKWTFDKKLNRVTQIFNKKCTAKLVHLLKTKFQVSCALDINWNELFQHFKNTSPSVSFLRKKFSTMLKCVPPEYKTDYQEALHFLSKKYCS